LEYHHGLRWIVSHAADSSQMIEYLSNHAKNIAQELAAVGVNLNLAPVVDLRPDVPIASDKYSKIYARAISDDPDVVSLIAKTYCTILHECGIKTTLKHFPGFGELAVDSHTQLGVLSKSISELETSDWLPFRRLVRDSDTVLMMGHVILKDVDPYNPVSISREVIQNVIREKWEFDGLIMTDDLTMRSISQYCGGTDNAAVAALGAGVDMLLISYDYARYYQAMYGLLNSLK